MRRPLAVPVPSKEVWAQLNPLKPGIDGTHFEAKSRGFIGFIDAGRGGPVDGPWQAARDPLAVVDHRVAIARLPDPDRSPG